MPRTEELFAADPCLLVGKREYSDRPTLQPLWADKSSPGRVAHLWAPGQAERPQRVRQQWHGAQQAGPRHALRSRGRRQRFDACIVNLEAPSGVEDTQASLVGKQARAE